MIKIQTYYMKYNFKNGMYYVDKSFPQKKKKKSVSINPPAETASKNPNSKIATHAYNVGMGFTNTEIISSRIIVIDGGMKF
ncbi:MULTISPECIES: hypothetical protein [Priestia]|uniref:hypothetical protein n=1 Tax=Priestia TaxID=2800373 RepID=UPI000D3EA6B5|nr:MULTISPECIES: hypothetical protein [Priestia]AWD68781.1 hypothetical protein C2I28_27515 [Priestia megaterium]MDC7767263.1 hypothetical protein [Priestia aryabhattai]MEB4888915.1 hypothetical protein [Priestia megaterium]WKG33545.1 hypothetical protein QYS54_27495 [Priestia aryabhattai]